LPYRAPDPQGVLRAVRLADSINKNTHEFRTALPPEPAQ
jgi:hypothetical protein